MPVTVPPDAAAAVRGGVRARRRSQAQEVRATPQQQLRDLLLVPMSISTMESVFAMDRRGITRRIAGVRPVGVGDRGHPEYAFHDVAPYLVESVVDVGEIIANMEPSETAVWMGGQNLDPLPQLIDYGAEISGGYDVPDAYGNTDDHPLDGIGSPSAHLDADLRRSLSFTASALRRPQARALLAAILGRRGRLLSFRTGIPDAVFDASGEITVTGKTVAWERPHGFVNFSDRGRPVVMIAHHKGEAYHTWYFSTIADVTGPNTVLMEESLGVENFTTIVDSVHPAGTFRLASDEITVRSVNGAGIEIDVAAIEVQA